MITPRFSLTQNSNSVIITIRAPYAHVSETEIFMDGNDFRFYSSPYYLRLYLPGAIVEDDNSSAKYDADKGDFVVTTSKANHGECFVGLDLLTNLLAHPKATDVSKPRIEVLTENSDSAEGSGSADDLQWFVSQEVPKENRLLATSADYGFAGKYTNVFNCLTDELQLVVSVKNPDAKSREERRKERLIAEIEDFDPDYFLSDYFQPDPALKSALVFTLPVCNDSWTEEEERILTNLPKKEYLLESSEIQSVGLSMVDILFAYCYDFRINEGDSTVETAWNISKISGTLSHLEVFESLMQVVQCGFRRSLVYPLYRKLELSQKVWEDTIQVMSSGKKSILRIFVQIYKLFNESEPRYLLNRIYIEDYCVWIQQANDSMLQSLTEASREVKITKDDVDLGLVEYENQAVEEMVEEIGTLQLKHPLEVSDMEVAAAAARSPSPMTSDSESDSESSGSSNSSDELDSDDITDSD